MHETDVKSALTDEQVEQGLHVHKAIWEALKLADGLPTDVVVRLISIIVVEILEQAGSLEIIEIPSGHLTMQ